MQADTEINSANLHTLPKLFAPPSPACPNFNLQPTRTKQTFKFAHYNTCNRPAVLILLEGTLF